MHVIPVRCGAARFGLAVLLMLEASGCAKQPKVEKTEYFPCGPKTVDVNASDGATPQAVYACGGDTVTWNPNGHTFLVEFKKDSPFDDDGKKFDNGHPKSAKAKHPKQLTIYEYRITVDTTHVFDPQVVGGGGN
jgi:plastocyanin